MGSLGGKYAKAEKSDELCAFEAASASARREIAQGLCGRSELRQECRQQDYGARSLGDALAWSDWTQDRSDRLLPVELDATIRPSTSMTLCYWRTMASILPRPIHASTSKWSMPLPPALSRCLRSRWAVKSTGDEPIVSAARPRMVTPGERLEISGSSSSTRMQCNRPTPITAHRRMGFCSAFSEPRRRVRAEISRASWFSRAFRKTSSRTKSPTRSSTASGPTSPNPPTPMCSPSTKGSPICAHSSPTSLTSTT